MLRKPDSGSEETGRICLKTRWECRVGYLGRNSGLKYDISRLPLCIVMVNTLVL